MDYWKYCVCVCVYLEILILANKFCLNIKVTAVGPNLKELAPGRDI